MIYIATTLSNEKIDLGPCYGCGMSKSQEAPADGLNAVFFSDKKHEQYKSIEVYSSENRLFFAGIVDEQKFEVISSGCFLTIKARSKAALLIDNEASPQMYKRPSLDLIFKRHVKPYGFTSISGNKSTFSATLEVERGMSEWDVLARFCSTCLNTLPVVNADGSIDASGTSASGTLTFSNDSNGINYTSIRQQYNRHKLISEIIVCEPYAPIYVEKIRDNGLIENGVSRRKFLSMADDTTSAEKVSIEAAEQMIAEAKKKFNEVRITCPGAIFAQIGSKARIEDHILGSLENLTVHDLEYSLSQNGEFTTFTLLEG